MTTRKATKRLPWDEWLTVWFGRVKGESEPDMHFSGPNGPDRTLMYGWLTAKGYDEHGRLTQPSLEEELKARGYDLTTLEFRVRRLPRGDGGR